MSSIPKASGKESGRATPSAQANFFAMNPTARVSLMTLLLCFGCASGTGVTDQASPTPDRDELERASAALDAFDALSLTEERYGVYVGGQRTGHMIRERVARDQQLVTISRVVSDEGDRESGPGTVLTEIFSAAPPHDAILLQRKDTNARSGTRSIRLTSEGYVGEFSSNGRQRATPLFDFQYRLADALAPQVWLRSGDVMSQCLTYPGYNLQRFARNFTTECLAQLTSYPIDGQDVDAVQTRRRNGTSVLRERSSGRELYSQASGLGVELRLEPMAIATQQWAPPRRHVARR